MLLLTTAHKGAHMVVVTLIQSYIWLIAPDLQSQNYIQIFADIL